MTRLILLATLCALAWHVATPQRQFAADLWRDVQIQWAWPEVER